MDDHEKKCKFKAVELISILKINNLKSEKNCIGHILWKKLFFFNSRWPP
jgi:hypothetical protein